MRQSIVGLDVVILDVCQKELSSFPKAILEDLLDALTKLGEGLVLSMPLSRPMPSAGRGIHEIRLKGRDGIFRVFCLLKKKDGIYVIHAFQKKNQKTPKKNLDLVRRRIGKLK